MLDVYYIDKAGTTFVEEHYVAMRWSEYARWPMFYRVENAKSTPDWWLEMFGSSLDSTCSHRDAIVDDFGDLVLLWPLESRNVVLVYALQGGFR